MAWKGKATLACHFLLWCVELFVIFCCLCCVASFIFVGWWPDDALRGEIWLTMKGWMLRSFWNSGWIYIRMRSEGKQIFRFCEIFCFFLSILGEASAEKVKKMSWDTEHVRVEVLCWKDSWVTWLCVPWWLWRLHFCRLSFEILRECSWGRVAPGKTILSLFYVTQGP